MSQHDHDDFAQLRDTFDQPITPSPQFAAKLREDLVAEISVSSSDRVRLNFVSTPATDGVPRVQNLTAGGWQGALMTAAAILIVLSLSFASLRSINHRGPGDDLNGITYAPLASATPQQATESVDVPSRDNDNDVFIGGVAGSDRSNQIGPVSTELSESVLTELTFDSFDRLNPEVTGAFGDLLVMQPVPMGETLKAVNLQTSELVWQYEGIIETGLASDGDLLFGYLADATTGRYGIVAIDLNTGIEQWFHPDPLATGEEYYGEGPIVANGLVYMNDGADTFYALNTTDGSLAWLTTLHNELDPIVTMYEGQPGTYSLPPTFAVDHSRFYALTGNQFLSALDPSNGEVIWNTQIGALPELGLHETTLSTHDGSLFVASRTAMLVDPSPSSNRELEFTDTLVQAIDGSIGEIKWTSNIPAYLANPVVAGTTLIVPTVDGLVTIDPDDGSTQAILEYSFESPEPYFADKATIRVSGDLAYISIATLSGIQILITDGADILQSGLIPASATSAASYPVAMYAYDGRLLVLPRDSPVYWFGPESESAPSATPEPNATPDS